MVAGDTREWMSKQNSCSTPGNEDPQREKNPNATYGLIGGYKHEMKQWENAKMNLRYGF